MSADPGDVLVRLEDVVKHFPVRGARRRHGTRDVIHAIDGVSLEVRRGETLGIVGESGSGKSTLARCILGLHEVTAGRIVFDGQDITALSQRRLRPVRREMQMIFQDPYGALNPRRRVGSIIGDPLAIHTKDSDAERKRRVQELMELVGLNPEHFNRFPAEFSGGQRQRIGVARALALRPKLIVCDEPVSALDVSIQAQILNLLVELQEEFKLTYVFIAHDLSVVRNVSDRIAVMYLGKVLERAAADDFYRAPRHPYSSALLAAATVPDPDFADRRERIVLVGDLPSPIHPPEGCRFSSRCPQVRPDCSAAPPPLEARFDDSPSHETACFYPLTDGGSRLHQVGPYRQSAAVALLSPDAPAPAATGPWEAGTDQAGVRLLSPDVAVPAATSPKVVVPAATDPWEVGTDQADVIQGRSPWRLGFEKLRHDRAAMIALGVVMMIALVAVLAPVIAALTGHGPDVQYPPPLGTTIDGLPKAPSFSFLFGTDDLGRDVLVRVAYGAQVSLLVGVLATLLAVAIGALVGLAAGYFGHIVDTVLARVVDVMLSIPFLLFAISLASVVSVTPLRIGPIKLQQGLGIVVIVIGTFSWATVARIVRGQVLAIREKEYIEAARSLGASSWRIIVFDVLPNVLAPIIIYATLLIPLSIVAEASLSFLGVGIPPPTPDWGSMIAEAQQYYQEAWWFLVFPCLALIITTLAFNILGDGIRDAFDPRATGVRA